MRIIKFLLISAVCFGVLIFLLSLLFPSTAVIERSGVIDAPMTVVYKEISHLKGWERWNPWTKADSTASLEYSGPEAGAGASYSWKGSRNSGRVVVIDSDPNKGVHYRMDVAGAKPVYGGFEIKPSADGSGTAIMWHLETKLGWTPWWKFRGFLADKIMGPTMDTSLTTLRTLCETAPR